ncbi:hypothetical protein GE061_018611 [Apolygus lucorum]|uniref:Uncharacterized protein n=1 Tax=Apolygus lucorum TaxID=248454 RepID=A0A8S9XE89_APOLU|nr:hypothetical protein GE061_018611 [Apolygus lucorum]
MKTNASSLQQRDGPPLKGKLLNNYSENVRKYQKRMPTSYYGVEQAITMAMQPDDLSEVEGPPTTEHEAVQKIRDIYRQQSTEILKNKECQVEENKTHEREALRMVEAATYMIEAASQTHNAYAIHTALKGSQQHLTRIAALLPAWKHLRIAYQGLEQQLKLEQAARRAAHDEIDRLTEERKKLEANLKALQPCVSLQRLDDSDEGPAKTLTMARKKPRPTVISDDDDDEDSDHDLTAWDEHTNEGNTTPLTSSLMPEVILTEGQTVSPLTIKLVTCPVCEARVKKLSAFRCLSCKQFWTRLVKKHREGTLNTSCTEPHPVPVLGCIHCRRRKYETIMLRLRPNRPLDIPKTTDEDLTAGDGGFQEGEVCKSGAETVGQTTKRRESRSSWASQTSSAGNPCEEP